MTRNQKISIGVVVVGGIAAFFWWRKRRGSGSQRWGLLERVNEIRGQLALDGTPYVPIPFAYNSDVIPTSSMGDLDAIAGYITTHPTIEVEIVGHTDDVGSEDFNWTLGRNRAEAVFRYLIGKGVDSNRIYPASSGESEPIATNETEAGRALNRRVEFNVM